MKLKRMISCTGFAALLGMTVSISQAEEPGPLLFIYDLQVKLGHTAEFRDGMAAWKSCYLENDGQSTWSVWRRLQGKAAVYTVTTGTANWAEFGADDPAGQACQSVMSEQIDSHLDSVTTSVGQVMPAISGELPADFDLAEVHSFAVADYDKFYEVVNDITGVLRDDEIGMVGIWYRSRGGGPGAQDYFVVVPYANFAAMDQAEPGPWQRYAKARGDEAMQEVRRRFGQSINRGWSYIYSRVDELGHSGEE